MFILLTQFDGGKDILINVNSISAYRELSKYNVEMNSGKLENCKVTEILLNTGHKFDVKESINKINKIIGLNQYV